MLAPVMATGNAPGVTAGWSLIGPGGADTALIFGSRKDTVWPPCDQLETLKVKRSMNHESHTQNGKWTKGSGQNYYTRTGPTKTQNRWWPLPAPLFLNLKRWCLYCKAIPLSSSKK